MTAFVVAGVALLALLIGATAGWLVGRRRDLPESSESAEIVAPAVPTVLQATPPPQAATRMTRAMLLDLIVEGGETGVAVVDDVRDVVFYNEQAVHLGMVHDHLLDDSVWEYARYTLESGDNGRFTFVPPQGTGAFVSTGRAPGRKIQSVSCLSELIADGGERYAVVYGHDDSENIRVEETRRDFVANVSHELKTPVAAIGLLAEALMESSDDPYSVEHFGERVRIESMRLGNMVSELIALSRLQGAERLPDLEDVEVDVLIDEVLDRAQINAEAAGIKLTTDDDSGLQVHGDHTLLLTALNNLVANAIAYSPSGTAVSMSRRVINVDGRPMVAIAVTDRGIGIAPQHQMRVFERFFRIDKARSRATGGTGLGLAIVKHVASNHGGAIELWSKPGTGSTFTLTIPLAAAARPSASAARESDKTAIVVHEERELSR
ncbi:ATP-binding protein [Williamsia sp. 1135]|uniref:sensor histidine kinase n=1 Tax=Williamsia sp. 1135 TaxID=1889262 RepID=UPI001F0AB386|nr:ATP-binding protein [Williamsia sp. 1135]